MDKATGRTKLIRTHERSATKVEYSKREVISDQVLTALDDKSKVAILCTQEDLDLLIQALYSMHLLGPANRKRNRYLDDLKLLQAKAFPKP